MFPANQLRRNDVGYYLYCGRDVGDRGRYKLRKITTTFWHQPIVFAVMRRQIAKYNILPNTEYVNINV